MCLNHYKKKDRDKYLMHAINSYNISVHKRTEYTPHELVFGRSARVPVAYYQMIRAMNRIALFKQIFDA